MKRWEVETNRHLSVNGLPWGWIETDTRTLSVQWLGVAGRALAEAVARLWNANSSGMVLDLSELPEHVSLMIEGCGTLWWAELRVASEATEGEGATAAEAYNAALKAWKEEG